MLHKSIVCFSVVEVRIYSLQRKSTFLDNSLIIHIKIYKEFWKSLGNNPS